MDECRDVGLLGECLPTEPSVDSVRRLSLAEGPLGRETFAIDEGHEAFAIEVGREAFAIEGGLLGECHEVGLLGEFREVGLLGEGLPTEPSSARSGGLT